MRERENKNHPKSQTRNERWAKISRIHLIRDIVLNGWGGGISTVRAHVFLHATVDRHQRQIKMSCYLSESITICADYSIMCGCLKPWKCGSDSGQYLYVYALEIEDVRLNCVMGKQVPETFFFLPLLFSKSHHDLAKSQHFNLYISKSQRGATKEEKRRKKKTRKKRES